MYLYIMYVYFVYFNVLALELHVLMLVSAPVSFLFFLCINICVVFFVQATSFNERNASLVAFQVL